MEIKKAKHSFKLVNNKTILSEFKYSKYSSKNWKVILICNVKTSEKYRQQGYAYNLLKTGIESIQNKYSDYMIYLAVKTDNIPAISLYKKLGFKIYGTLKQENGLNYVMATSDRYIEVLADGWKDLFTKKEK